ncbi:MAG: AI-2E family transporter, partial [Rhizobiaceae bacterium]|nr:AI-2E family transporter [Rhizobiaceae bacterium]
MGNETNGAPAVTRRSELRGIRRLLLGIFLFTAIYALYFARDFFMPVLLAFLLALMLTPIVRFLRKRGIPESVSATLLVVFAGLFIGGAGYMLSGPVIDLANNAPRIGTQLSEKLDELRHPFDRMLRISEQVERVTQVGEEPGVQRVVVSQPGILSQAAGNLLSGGTTVAITFVL